MESHTKQLQGLGFSETESTLILALLQASNLSASGISKVTNIKRTTAHAAAEELVSKGVLEKDISKNTTFYSIQSAQSIDVFLARQERLLQEKRVAAATLIPELASLPRSQHHTVPRITFVEGENVTDHFYKNVPLWIENMQETGETTSWGVQDHTFITDKRNVDLIDWMWKIVPPEFETYLFINDSTLEKEFQENTDYDRRHVRLWKGDPFTSSQWILGDYVIYDVRNVEPNYLVQIKDPILARNSRNLLKTLWEQENL